MYKNFPSNIIENISRDSAPALFETQKYDKDNYLSYLFLKPTIIISCSKPNKINKTIQKLELFHSKGYYLAGFFSYECGLFFEKKLPKAKKSNHPLIWFGVYEKPYIFNHRTGKFDRTIPFLHKTNKKYSIENILPNLKYDEFNKTIKKIKNHIEDGDTYQVNYTFKLKFNLKGSNSTLYNDLKNNQKVSYAAFINNSSFSALSFSPEIFFRKTSSSIIVKPMKGTAGRDITVPYKSILKDDKNRSENLMIVDLLRNDLGKISKIGSVNTKKLFEVEKYQTLFQMTSTIEGKINKNVSIFNIFKSIFPSGSVTGAPKIRTMQIISEIEKEPRGIYTGAIGFIKPNADAVFNVAIRSIFIENGKGEMGIGSGIVYDSQSWGEYQEDLLKARFLTDLVKPKLIETMLWEKKKGIFLFKLHLNRLLNSAKEFKYNCSIKQIKKTITKIVKAFNPKHKYRLRLLLSSNGEFTIEYKPIKLLKQKTGSIAISAYKIDSGNKLLKHKTTFRKLYDQEHKKYKTKGFTDVIFLNQRNEVCEGAISNIFIKRNNGYLTPPLQCGLLNGTFRQYFMKRNSVKEKILTIKDLASADDIFIGNSVLGKIKVTF